MPVSRMLAAESVLNRDDLIEAWHPATTIGEPTRSSMIGSGAVDDGQRTAGRLQGRGKRRIVAATTFLAAAMSLTTAAPVDAASGYCSPTGDYCTSAGKHHGVRELTVSTFSFRGKVDICVQAPGGTDPVCRTRTLKAGKGKAADLYTASIVWSKNYPRTPKGTRTVIFQNDDTQLGPKLTFTAK